MGVPFTVLMDHKTLENFNTQWDLSRRQARWMEFMSQYDTKIVYMQGEDNTVANALSQVMAQDAATSAKSMVGEAYAHCTEEEDDVISMVMVDKNSSPLTLVCALTMRA